MTVTSICVPGTKPYIDMRLVENVAYGPKVTKNMTYDPKLVNVYSDGAFWPQMVIRRLQMTPLSIEKTPKRQLARSPVAQSNIKLHI